ncbi:MAG: PHP domain-containing protein, partial [Octadecabacter sp.]
MPENDHAHPRRTLPEDGVFTPNPRGPFVELGVLSCFSFLRGASDAVDLASEAWALGYDAIGIADVNTLAGVVRLYLEATRAGLRPLIGCRLELLCGAQFLAYPVDRDAYGRLSTLLSKGKRGRPDGSWQDKAVTEITLADLAAHQEGLQLIVLPPANLDHFARDLPRYVRALPQMRHIAAAYLYRGDDVARINRLDSLAMRHGLAILASNDVLYHAPDRRPLQDVMSCIREKCTIHTAGTRLEANGERHLKPAGEMQRLFAPWPHAIAATRKVADACRFDLRDLRYEYPSETLPAGRDADDVLRENTYARAALRWPDGLPAKTRDVIERELAMIAKLEIARYILTIESIVKFAREDVSPPILCQGRGSAANSAVCYALGITAVDPAQHALLFERFISEERREPPDIDVDFEHERREEVIQHLYGKYG